MCAGCCVLVDLSSTIPTKATALKTFRVSRISSSDPGNDGTDVGVNELLCQSLVSFSQVWLMRFKGVSLGLNFSYLNRNANQIPISNSSRSSSFEPK